MIVSINKILMCSTIDTTNSTKQNLKIITGFKLTKSYQTPNTYIHSILGLEYSLPKSKCSFAYRNTFNIQFIGKRDNTFAQKSIRFMQVKNSFDFHYKFENKLKTNFIKTGLGIYFLRDESWYQQTFIYQTGHYQGFELSVYTKLKWLNLGIRHQIQTSYLRFDNKFVGSFDILNRYFTQLCIEVPINIK